MEQSLDKLVDLAREVGGAAFPMLVYRVWVGAITDIAIAVIVCVALPVFLKAVGPRTVKAWNNSDDGEGVAVLGAVGIAIACILCVISVCCAVDSIPALLTPEGEALLMILRRG